ncbi:MAG: DUF2142 domain-containing protein [Demequinaceae bacterium]|nr:DUF2142 domain-containing protein [Demequinaceae bacterium]
MSSTAAATVATPNVNRRKTLSLRTLVARVPLTALPLLFLALLAWGFASPVGASPDDDFHLVSTWCSGTDASECLAGSDGGSRVVPFALISAPCFAFDADKSGSCQGDALTTDSAPTVDTTRGNFDGTYPPLFYAVDGLIASPHIANAVLWIRALNAAVLIAIAGAALVVLPARRRAAMTLTWLLTSVPLVVFLTASNNPSSWALSGGAVAWIAWWSYFESESRKRVGLAAVAILASAIAIGARADAAVYVSMGIAVAAFLSWRQVRHLPALALIPPIAVIAAGAAVFLNSRQAGAIDGLNDGASTGHAGITLLANNVLQLPSLWTGGFGSWGLGWLDTAMPPVVLWSTAGACIGVAFTGLRHLGRRHALALGAVGVALAAVPLFVLQAGGDAVGANVQPRYIWPLMTLLVGLIIARPNGGLLILGRLQTWLIGIAIAGANAVALYTNMRRYITGVDVREPSLNADVEWWWRDAPSPMTVWLLGSLAFAVAVALILVDYRRVVRKDAMEADSNTSAFVDRGI